MKAQHTWKLMLIPVFVLGACSGTRLHKTNWSEFPVLFNRSFINFAWGYQNRGWLIDGKGVMKAYRVTSAANWHTASQAGPDSGYISREDLQANNAQADKMIYQIPQKTLQEKASLISSAASGSISEKTRQAYDAGQLKTVCYQWDTARGKFREVLLSLSGDWGQTNSSAAAVELNKWLDELNQIYADSLANSE